MPGAVKLAPVPRPALAKAALALRICVWYVRVQALLRRYPLPELVDRLGRPASARRSRVPPRRLGRAVYRVLAIGGRRARCLVTSLVLYRLLREQGDAAELVIGLPTPPHGAEAHAWVEIEGADVGPPPGRGDHLQLARYG
ncbi:MAG: lasso peptide biosynthesis B2 protein [Thermoleophilaceae bacterium]